MPMGGVDHFGDPIEPHLSVDITAVMDTKEQMLACHTSQCDWLRADHGIGQYTSTMKEMAAAAGKRLGVKYGESFRQHLGSAYPHNNSILELLGAD
jgi:LmbE family N-acetylglucosaminyl deacetylase